MKFQTQYEPKVILAAGYWLERWHGKRHPTRGRVTGRKPSGKKNEPERVN